MEVPRLVLEELRREHGPDAPDRSEIDRWRNDAACRDVDTAIFFSELPEGIEAAKAVCAPCPVREVCLYFALTTRQDNGVWGGLDEDQRRRVSRNRQEPRKDATRTKKPQGPK